MDNVDPIFMPNLRYEILIYIFLDLTYIYKLPSNIDIHFAILSFLTSWTYRHLCKIKKA